MNRYYPKRVNPKTMITRFQEIFKPIGLKKTAFRNLLLTTIAISVAKTFRINEIASCLPLVVKTEKSKQKRFLRFLETALPLNDLQRAWCGCVVGCLWRRKAGQHLLLLVDETDLIAGWKAIVVAVAFRHRAIPVFWFIYSDQEIRDGIYKSHNEILQGFCQKCYQWGLEAAPGKGKRPLLVFDRGFARGKFVIKFLKEHDIPFLMRVCRNVSITYQGDSKKLDDLENGYYPEVLYHKQHQIPLQLYVITDEAFKDPMYLISNSLSGHQMHHCYKRRMQIEHGFRDIKSCFGFGKLVLRKPTKSRVALLWCCACLAYGLLFLSYEKSAEHWAKAFNGKRKSYSVITVIRRTLSDVWNKAFLISFFSELRCRGQILYDTQ